MAQTDSCSYLPMFVNPELNFPGYSDYPGVMCAHIPRLKQVCKGTHVLCAISNNTCNSHHVKINLFEQFIMLKTIEHDFRLHYQNVISHIL